MMKRIFALLLAALMLLSLAACGKDVTPPETTPAATEPADEGMEHFDLNNIDLDGIGELFVQRDQAGSSKIRLDGLCTPVVMELEGTDIVSISAYGTTVYVDERATDYSSIYGNLWPVIYEHEELIFLNIWHDEVGYSCVLFPDGTYLETFPDDVYSIMVYVDEEDRMVRYQLARKFQGIEQWDTGPIDMATSRDEFYYSIDDASWNGTVYNVTPRERYTISDCFELDEIFDRAKANGLYPEFETLDDLLAYNAQRLTEEDPSGWSDSTREEVRYFDELQASYDYDQAKNLICETFYEPSGEVYFLKEHTYDEKNREISGVWSFHGKEVYRYTNAYDSKDRLSETVWYQEKREVERFTYTYDKQGGHTETFSQNGEKKYTYTFNAEGELTAHSLYRDGLEIKNKDVSTLVKAQLLTDIWLPTLDNDPLHSNRYYDGTIPTENPDQWLVRDFADGSRILIQGDTDEEDGMYYEVRRHYDDQGRLTQVSYCLEGSEYSREEYRYDENGCSLETGYDKGQKAYTIKKQYNDAGQLIRSDEDYVNPQSYYIYTDENGETVDKEVTYTTRSETYRYNAQGLLVETVVYEDGKESARTAYDYDEYGYVLPRLDTYDYVYSADGILEEIWLIYEDHAAGVAQLRSRTVYVTAENARQLQEIMRTELSWF